MRSELDGLRTLVLNADMQPLSWAPLSVWSWQDALVAVLQDRVIQVKIYEDIQIRAASRSFPVPSVVALKGYRRRCAVAFTRYHVFLRDQFKCQYCGQQLPAKRLTFDHVIPKSRGGRSDWTNIVACCSMDNLRKGNKTVKQAGMRLLRKPFAPTPFEMDAIARKIPHIHGELHNTWLDFLYWDTEIEN